MTKYQFLILHLLLFTKALFAAEVLSTSQTEFVFPQHSVVLNIASATDIEAISPVIDAFEKKHPQIQVNYFELSSQELYTKIKNGELSNVDVVMSSAMDLQIKLANDGFAEKLDITDLVGIPGWSHWGEEVFGFTFEPVAMAVNTAAFSKHPPPSNHEEFANALRVTPDKYMRKVGTYDIRLSGTGYLFASQDSVASGISGRIYEGLARSQAKLYCCTSNMLDDLARGDIIVAYNVLGSYALSRARVDKRIKVILPDDYSLVMSRVVFVPKFSRHFNEAQDFVRFLLSREGQEIIANQSGLIAIREDVSGESTSRYLSENNQLRFSPIKVKPSILVFQDKMKRDKLVREWTGLFSVSDTLSDE